MKRIELQNPEYVRINYKGSISYGGNQNWFSEEKWMSRDYRISKWGCGLIALSDLFLYLARANRMYQTDAVSLARVFRPVLEWEDYQKYIYYIHTRFAQVTPEIGVNGVALAFAVRKYCIKYKIPLTIAWKGFLDGQQMLRAIRKMLKENLPVIISIGPNTPIVFRGKGITFYTMTEKEEFIPSGSQNVHGHYVVVTGIIGLKHKRIMLRISSWGKEYYMDYQEYRDYVEQEGDTLTSSLLYLSKEDGTLF